MAFPRRPSAFLRYLIPGALILIGLYALAGPSDLLVTVPTPWRHRYAAGEHPIDWLIKVAEKDFDQKLARESHTLAEAAAAYRKRRGRHPPPGFDKWFEFAQEKEAVIVEDFWDQIYHDLEPFWALPAGRIRKDAWNFEMQINIRNGNATSGSDWFWTKIWLKMIKTFDHLLPDMDLALNAMDEPRMVVPWEQVDEYMRLAHKTRHMARPRDVVSEFSTLPPPGQGPEKDLETPAKEWEGEKHYWLIAQRGCHPKSLARQSPVITNFDTTPLIKSSFALQHMQDGYVWNYTLSTDFCHQSDLQALEGVFVEPLSTSATKVLFPMFGGSKLAVNNEILLPAPMYWNEEERFMGSEGADIPWEEKKDGVIWRGVATGGKNRENNWKSFQRHRFVAMNNATKLNLAETRQMDPVNFALPPKQYGLKAQQATVGALGQWVDKWSDVGFVDLMCGYKGQGKHCNYTDPHYEVMEGMKMAKQFQNKYLPDIDGNSFSGRYLGFLRSTSLPIKATLWREWHDSRLVAWKHFVPMDSRFGDWYGIMEYFLGNAAAELKGHDEVARKIAMNGKDWAAKVLRKEDMQVYVLRLLLEYARVSDERREVMGWVGDLVKGELAP
ncbi:family 90 putative glycosyltransferase [Podospora australis]|uniref:Family 90 putative glycosyltransferase n=1 Tax=Podospora australis TaxID=1536484 RepID=A0AAN6WTK8_9PEZI|nr:family 90 putative glycosyltransferase [Podospora australis]